MAHYVDAGTQTVWAGLSKGGLVRPDFLLTAPDTTTPPDDMLTQKSHMPDMLPRLDQPYQRHKPTASTGPSLLERREKRPGLPTRISLPSSELDDEVLPSPPPTQAALSPLPAANKLHAGHTPLLPRARSPVQDEEEQVSRTPTIDEDDQSASPQEDEALEGPLILPTNPVDGAGDRIALDVLDEELNKLAREQERFSKLKDAPEPAPIKVPDEDELSLSQKSSADSRASNIETFDGVLLKSPPLNFGMPLGQA